MAWVRLNIRSDVKTLPMGMLGAHVCPTQQNPATRVRNKVIADLPYLGNCKPLDAVNRYFRLTFGRHECIMLYCLIASIMRFVENEPRYWLFRLYNFQDHCPKYDGYDAR